MIDDAVAFIRKEVVRHLSVADEEVIVESASKLIEENNKSGAYISVVNIQEETVLRNTPHVEKRLGQTHYIEPPVHLNLFLLFAFEFQAYDTSLVHLSKTIELFQSKRWFAAANQHATNPFPASLEKLVFEMEKLDFEQLNNLWGVLGGGYFPSVVYKVRLVKVQSADTQAAPEITTIQLDTVVK